MKYPQSTIALMAKFRPGDIVMYTGSAVEEANIDMLGIVVSGPTFWGQWRVQFYEDCPEGSVTSGKNLVAVGTIGLLGNQKRKAYTIMKREHDIIAAQLKGLRRSLKATR